MPEPLTGPGWSARLDGRNMVVSLSGDWIAREVDSPARIPPSLLGASDIEAVLFDSSRLNRWDSSLLLFLSTLRESARKRHLAFDHKGLPAAACRLLELLPRGPRPLLPLRIGRTSLVERMGSWA